MKDRLPLILHLVGKTALNPSGEFDDETLLGPAGDAAGPFRAVRADLQGKLVRHIERRAQHQFGTGVGERTNGTIDDSVAVHEEEPAGLEHTAALDLRVAALPDGGAV